MISEEVITEVRSHLKAALVQALPSDDAIIIGHIREAYALLTPKHIHKAKYSDGRLLDECALCGHDIRDTEIHLSTL